MCFAHSLILTKSVVDPGEGPGGPNPPPPLLLLLDQTEARRAEKKLGETRPPPSPYLRVWMTTPHLISRSGSGTGNIRIFGSSCPCLEQVRVAKMQQKPAYLPCVARLPQYSSSSAAPFGATTPRLPTFTCHAKYSIILFYNESNPSINQIFVLTQ